MMKSKNIYLSLIALVLLIQACVEEINIITETEFESALVVEATITNQVMQQQVKLSRTYRLEEDGPSPENNAIIKVVSSTGQSYSFQEISNGLYGSINEFAAEQNVDYHLEILTNDGRSYSSQDVNLTTPTQIDQVYVERDFNENEEEGVSVYVDTFDPTGSSKFYRFEYEESYKIVAPLWIPEDVTYGIEDGMLVFPLVPRPIEELICFNTVISNSIDITSTNLLVEDRLEQYRVRFLNRNNYIISHRYSILVKQYVQSQAAYSYYEALSELSESENILSETQPGFLQGNMMSLSNSNEKVVGFFEVSSVDEKRIYFNYEDLFPGEPLPPYAQNCEQFFTPPTSDGGGGCPLCSFIEQGFKYFGPHEPTDPENEGPIVLVNRECGDCTALGNSEPPDFWID